MSMSAPLPRRFRDGTRLSRLRTTAARRLGPGVPAQRPAGRRPSVDATIPKIIPTLPPVVIIDAMTKV